MTTQIILTPEEYAQLKEGDSPLGRIHAEIELGEAMIKWMQESPGTIFYKDEALEFFRNRLIDATERLLKHQSDSTRAIFEKV